MYSTAACASVKGFKQPYRLAQPSLACATVSLGYASVLASAAVTSSQRAKPPPTRIRAAHHGARNRQQTTDNRQPGIYIYIHIKMYI